MKTLLLLLLMPFVAFSQLGVDISSESACGGGVQLLTVSDENEDLQPKKFVPREVPFLDKYNLQEGKYYLFINKRSNIIAHYYDNLDYYNASLKELYNSSFIIPRDTIYYIDDLDYIISLKEKYNGSTTIPDTAYYFGAHEFPLFLIQNNLIVDKFWLNSISNQMTTSCGTIEFDTKILLKKTKKGHLDVYINTFNAIADVEEVIKQLSTNLIYAKTTKTLKKVITFKYVDSLSMIDSILDSPYWLEYVTQQIESAYESTEALDVASERIGETGLLLEFWLRKELRWREMAVEKWKQIEGEIPSYAITIETYAPTPIKTKNIISKIDESKYSLTVISR